MIWIFSILAYCAFMCLAGWILNKVAHSREDDYYQVKERNTR